MNDDSPQTVVSRVRGDTRYFFPPHPCPLRDYIPSIRVSTNLLNQSSDRRKQSALYHAMITNARI